MPLSVLSALARLNIDPWQEAARLAGLPGEAATRRLVSLIAVMPGGPSAHPDPGTIAARLIALLPRRASPVSASTKIWPRAGAAAKSWIVIYVIFMVFAVGAQWIASSRQTPPQVGNAHPLASSTVSLQMPPLNAGR